MWGIVERFAPEGPETLPDALRARRRLSPRAEAFRDFHFPENEAALAASRRRLAFEDFLLLQLGLAILRSRTGRQRGVGLAPPGKLVARLREHLPFRLTGAQERVWDEIRRDLAIPSPMHRLLQGDVGSGKTVVAALAVLTAVESACLSPCSARRSARASAASAAPPRRRATSRASSAPTRWCRRASSSAASAWSSWTSSTASASRSAPGCARRASTRTCW
jgi:hypothetical protein